MKIGTDGELVKVTNDQKGIRQLSRRLNKLTIERVLFEPTGSLHGDFERLLHETGFPPVKVNPRQARRFAEARGILAKTDRLDAGVLAHMGQALDLKLTTPRTSEQLELNELYMAHQAFDAGSDRDREPPSTVPKFAASKAKRSSTTTNRTPDLDHRERVG